MDVSITSVLASMKFAACESRVLIDLGYFDRAAGAK
jgi:hypothetical protein